MCATDACFKHASTPDSNIAIRTMILNQARFCMTAYATQFNVNNPARPQLVRVARVREGDY